MRWAVYQVLPSGSEVRVARASNRQSIDKLYDWLKGNKPGRTYYIIFE